MPCVTFLHEREGLVVESNKDLDKLLQEVRGATRKDWRIVERRLADRRHGFLWRRRSPQWRYSLLVAVGAPEYQVINFWMPWDWSINHYVPAEVVFAYLYGLLNTPTPASEDGLLGELDALIATEAKLNFARDGYDDDEATAYGISLLDFMRKRGMELRRRLAASGQGVQSFQAGVSAWMDECFPSAIVHDRTERGDRLLEEVLELLQSHNYDRSRVATLVDYVYDRPVGEPGQEVGGVMVTLAAYCMVAGLDMHAEGNRELARITQPEVMAKIRRKQEAKNALHFDTPLPGNAAAPTQEKA